MARLTIADLREQIEQQQHEINQLRLQLEAARREIHQKDAAMHLIRTLVDDSQRNESPQ